MSEIKPALTPEEWAKNIADVLDGYVDWDIGTVDVRLGMHSGRTTLEDRHILAALALRGQPFGFTWAMVDAIRDSVETAQEGTGWQVDPQDVLALAAADAIAALLPPR